MTTELIASQGTVQGSKEILIKDLKRVVGDADNLLKEVVNSSAEEFTAARSKVEAKLGEAKARLDGARVAVANKAIGAADATNAYARENPWKLIGVAAVATGLLAALLLHRR
jgi:ElaB/YqjD/DUF883 family membrane-anchored ribosome-binding protein